MKARIAPTRRREAAPSMLQSSAAICQISTASESRPAAAAAPRTTFSDRATSSPPSPKLTKAPAATRPAAASAFGPDAERNTGQGRRTQGSCDSARSQTALSPANSRRNTSAPASSSATLPIPSPRLRVPLWPVPMPSTVRPGASNSSEPAAAAVAAGCRDLRFVTHWAIRGRSVASASIVAATHGSIAFPGVSATPTMS